ncbi:nucleolar protein,Nop52-domain-containing protein [Biscogniauxia mediterranea]|nr:nucleolar protein,Nop52-domain-containing protein [Biscogniauxia mediterranea]
MAANDDTASMPFIKNLASSDRKLRDSALSTLRAFLSNSQRRLSETDNLKLWKGLFYSLWMCDRALPQQQLCGELAGLARALPRAAAVPAWAAAFWATLAREWTTGIDVLRMEKFLLLVRRVLAASLEWVLEEEGEGKKQGGEKGRKKKRNSNNKKRITATKGDENEEEEEEEEPAFDRATAMLAVLADWPLERTGDLAKVPVGLRLHFLDRIRELVEAQTRSACKPVRARARESLADERLPWNNSSSSSSRSETTETTKTKTTGDSWDGFED